MKHNVMATANALALTMGVVYVACAALVAIIPGFFRAMASSWFHGWNMEILWTGQPRSNFILGLVSVVVVSWLIGYLFAWTYNKFVK